MAEIQVKYHREAGTYWAEVPEIEGFSSAASDLLTLRDQVREAIREIKGEGVELNELFGPGALAGVTTSHTAPKPTSYRGEILERAAEIVTKDRNATYGEPEDSFASIAGLWSTYLGRPVHSHDVAAMMALMKIARIAHNPGHEDSWTDGIGYLACGAEAVQKGSARGSE